MLVLKRQQDEKPQFYWASEIHHPSILFLADRDALTAENEKAARKFFLHDRFSPVMRGTFVDLSDALEVSRRLHTDMMAMYGHAPVYDVVVLATQNDYESFGEVVHTLKRETARLGRIIKDFDKNKQRRAEVYDEGEYEAAEQEYRSAVEALPELMKQLEEALGTRPEIRLVPSRGLARIKGFIETTTVRGTTSYFEDSTKHARLLMQPDHARAIQLVNSPSLGTTLEAVTRRTRDVASHTRGTELIVGPERERLITLPLGMIPIFGATSSGKSAFCDKLAGLLRLPYVYATEAQTEGHPRAKSKPVWVRGIDKAISIAAENAVEWSGDGESGSAYAGIVDSGREAMWATPGGMGLRGLPNLFSTHFTITSNALSDMLRRVFVVLNPTHVDDTYLREFMNTIALMAPAWIHVKKFNGENDFVVEVNSKPLRESANLKISFGDDEMHVAIATRSESITTLDRPSVVNSVHSMRTGDSAYSDLLNDAFRAVARHAHNNQR